MAFFNMYVLNESGNVLHKAYVNVNTVASLQNTGDGRALIKFSTGETGLTAETYAHCKNVLKGANPYAAISVAVVSEQTK